MRGEGLTGAVLQAPGGPGPERAGRAGAGRRARQDPLPGRWASVRPPAAR